MVLRLALDQIRSFEFQGKCLRPTTSTSPTKRNLMTNETRQWGDRMVEVGRINSEGISLSI